ncbi:hypothetical protein B9G39_16665 [Zooshikella ganghwensis]|uniref:HMA domain-containing protein n=1 Tax=Zooshikella ganghwensis TaxID=202772 RepID=A0A4P9VSY5_9GAMM|nr:hypothetical protein B9G39_16665 [Zooshikella ganghwensis]
MQCELSQHQLLIEGAGCASCVGKIENALKQVPGVQQATMNFAQRMVEVSGSVTDTQLINAVGCGSFLTTSNYPI